MGIRIAPRIQRIELEDDYTGIWLDAQMNPPVALYEDLAEGKIELIFRALARIVRASNVDGEDGTPIDLSTAAGWHQMPMEFTTAVMKAWQVAAKRPLATTTTPESSPSTSTDAAAPRSDTSS